MLAPAIIDPHLEKAVDEFIAVSQRPAKQRSRLIGTKTDALLDYAHNYGFPPHIISRLLHAVICPNQLDPPSMKLLIAGLIPSAKVSSADVGLIFNSLGPGPKPSTVTQNLLLRWITSVRGYIDDPTVLDKFYGVLFNLIDLFGIRTSLCYLLAVVTRRGHVKPFRIRKLLLILPNVGTEPAFLGLLRIFQGFQPHLMAEKLQRLYPLPKHVDQSWEKRLQEWNGVDRKKHLQQFMARRAFNFTSQRDSPSFNLTQFTPHGAPRKPCSSVWNLRGPDNFVRCVDNNGLPSYLDVLPDGFGFQGFTCPWNGKSSRSQFDHWLTLFLNSHWGSEQDREVLTGEVVSVLRYMVTYIEDSGHTPSAIEDFLGAYFKYWDGIKNRALILDLVVKLPMRSLRDSQRKLLNSLERAMLSSGTLESRIAYLRFQDRLALHWSAAIDISPLEIHQVPTDERNSVAFLIDHCSLLALSLLSVESSPSQALIHTILFHLDIVSKSSKSQSPPPSPLVIYFLMFISPNAQALSTICTILTTHRHNFEHNKSNITQPIPLHDRDQINALNGILMDTANLLWRSRAFNATDSNAHACLLVRSVFLALLSYAANIPVPSQNIAAVFGLSSHPLLSGTAIAALRQVEDSAIAAGKDIKVRHAGPVTQRSLGALERDGGVRGVYWKEYRIGVLDWLFDRGLSGVQELMGSTMKGMGLGRDGNQRISNGVV